MILFPIKRIVLGFLITALISLLNGCADAPNNTLRFAVSSAPVTLDPRFATDATSSRVNRLLYARLVDFDEQLLPQASLAEWQILSPQHYRFTLGELQRDFHNGVRLTAQDVKATYDSILDEKTASPHRGALKLIERIEVVNENTVDFHLDRADPLFPGYLVIGILPRKLLEQNHPFNQQPMGSGDFRFMSWPEEGKLLIERLRDKQQIELVKVKNPTVRVLKLIRGEVDMMQNNLPPELIQYVSKQDDVVIQKRKGSNYSYLGFNLEDPLTGQLAVREAIAYALNRKEIIRYVLGGAAREASALLPPEHWAGHPRLNITGYQPEKARALLKQAGFSADAPLRLTYKTSNDPFRIRLATIIQQQLADVGIEVELRSYDWGTFYGDIKAGRFQMYSLSWVGIKTPDIFRYVFHSSAVPPNGANRGRYTDAKVDLLIEQAESATDIVKQAKAYRQLQERVLQQLPYVPLWYEDHVFISRKEIHGFTLAHDGNFDGLRNVSR